MPLLVIENVESKDAFGEILPMFLPIDQARGIGQVRGVGAKTLREVTEQSDSLGDFGVSA